VILILFLNVSTELSFNPIAGRASNKMRKLFKQPSRGKLVVHVVWTAHSNTPNQVQISAKRLLTNRIVHASRQSKYTVDYTLTKNALKVEFDRLEPGDYELTLYNITAPIQTIYLCSGILFIANPAQSISYEFVQVKYVLLKKTKCSTNELLVVTCISEKCFLQILKQQFTTPRTVS